MNRPPFRPKTPIKSCGPYVGAGDPKVKAEEWDEIGKDLYDAGYNQLYTFLILNTPLRFLPLNDANDLKPEWVEHIDTMIDRLAFWRIQPAFKFADQYHEGENNDPFAALTVEQLYSSVYKTSNPREPWKYAWITWDEDRPRQYTNFRPTSDLGRGIFAYVRAVVRSCKKALDTYPDFRVVVTWGNETMAVFKGNETHPDKTRGDRDEVTYWLMKEFENAGFVKNKNLLVNVDYLAFRPDVRHVDYNIMGKVSRDLTKKGQHLEIHGIKTLDDIKKYLNAGVNWKSTLFSTDGDLKMQADYRDLGHSQYHVDLKLDTVPPNPIFPTDFMKFWRRYFPKYRTYVK